MFRIIHRGVAAVNTTRRIVALCIIGGISIGTLVGWATGLFTWIMTTISHLWTELSTWLQSPWGIEHFIATAAVVLGPVLLIFILIVVISDD